MADNQVLGRGKLYFTPYVPGTTTGGTKGYFGNTPALSLAQTNTKLDHYSSEGGLKIKDRSVLLQTDVTITFDTDNIDLGNLVLWFGGNNTDAEPADAPTTLGTVKVIGRANQIYGSLIFESDNPVGDNLNYWFPYVSLSPSGNFALKGDTWQQLSFSAEALKRDNATERVYIYAPGGPSTAVGDTTPEFTADTAALGTASLCTGGTVTATGTHAALANFTGSYTLTGGTVGYISLHNGTTIAGTIHTVTGASGSVTLNAPTSGSYTAKLYNEPDCSGAPLATSGSITIS